MPSLTVIDVFLKTGFFFVTNKKLQQHRINTDQNSKTEPRIHFVFRIQLCGAIFNSWKTATNTCPYCHGRTHAVSMPFRVWGRVHHAHGVLWVRTMDVRTLDAVRESALCWPVDVAGGDQWPVADTDRGMDTMGTVAAYAILLFCCLLKGRFQLNPGHISLCSDSICVLPVLIYFLKEFIPSTSQSFIHARTHSQNYSIITHSHNKHIHLSQS